MPLKSIALFYGHVARNIGDLAINQGTVNLVRSVFPDALLRVVLLDVENSPNLPHSLVSFGDTTNVEFVHFASKGRDASEYAVNPGRLLDDCGCGDVDLVLLAAGEHLFSYKDNNNARNLFWRTLPAFSAKAAGIRSAVLPSTFGPYQDEDGRNILQQFAVAGTHIAVRDLHSKEEIEQVAPTLEPTSALDPAFFLAPPLTGEQATTGRVGIVMRSEGVGIRLSAKRRAQFDKAVTEDGFGGSVAARFTTGLVRRILADRKTSVRIFIQMDTDLPLAEAVAAAFADRPEGARIDIVKVVDIADYLSKLSEVDCVVASRFHALIFAMVCGKPGFGVYFPELGHKVPGLMALLGRPDLSRGLEPDALDEAIQTVAAWTRDPSRSYDTVWTSLEEQRSSTRDWLRHLTTGKKVQPLADQPLGIARVLMAQATHLRNSLAEAEQRKLPTQLNRLKREFEAEKDRAASLEERLAAERAGFEDEVNEARTRMAELEEELANERQRFKREMKAGKAREASLEERLATERAGFEDEVNRARSRMAELEEEFSRERQRFEQEMKAGKAREAALEKKIADEQMSVKVLEGKLVTSRTAARSAAQRMLALENRLDQVENSIAFRLGTALVTSAKSPRNLTRLPREIGRLHREHRSRSRTSVPSSGATVGQEGGQPAPSASPTLSLTKGEIVALFEKGGVEALFVDIRTLNPDPAAARTALIAAAEVLAGEGYFDAEFELTQKAVLINASDASLRALHWSATRRGDLATAWDCIRRIEKLYGSNPTPTQQVFLERLHRGHAYKLSILDKIPERQKRSFHPIQNRVCYVLHNSLPFSSGGYATRGHGLATGLKTAGIEVVALTRPGYPLDLKAGSANNVALQESVDEIVYRRVLSPSTSDPSGIGNYMMAAADALTAEIAAIRPEAVIAASNHLTGLPALIAARRLGLPFFYEVRGFWEITRLSREPEFEQTTSFKVQKLLEAELAKRADHIFTLTSFMRGELIERGVDPERITLLPNSCEIERFTPRARDAQLAARLDIPENVPVIGYVGTFVQYEGLELLVEAAAGLREQGHEFRLLLVGNENASGQDVGPITMEINRIAAERGLDQWLIMPGRVPHEEVEAYYSLIDIAPFPRKAQPVTELVSPMKPLEAYAMEKAVVVSSVGALLEMVEHEKTGLVFEKDSVASLTDALARLIADPALRTRLGREGRRWVEAERTWEATAKRAAGVINQVIRTDDQPAPAQMSAGAG